MPDVYGFDMKAIDGKGKVLLGLTPQYEGLQKLHAEYAPRGFAVLGFPCNQFGGQEPGSDADVKKFCATNYGVTFPMFSKIDVNGQGRAPLYSWLTSQATRPDGPGATPPTAPEVRTVIQTELDAR